MMASVSTSPRPCPISLERELERHDARLDALETARKEARQDLHGVEKKLDKLVYLMLGTALTSLGGIIVQLLVRR